MYELYLLGLGGVVLGIVWALRKPITRAVERFEGVNVHISVRVDMYDDTNRRD